MTTINVSSLLYARIRVMAENEGCAVSEIIDPLLHSVASLDVPKCRNLVRYARLMASGDTKWTEIIETMLDRAEVQD